MLLLLLALLQNPSARADEAACLQTGQGCSEIDIDRPLARASYEKGCVSKDAYACSRLGQYFEVKGNEPTRAAEFYDRGCKGGDRFGCEQGDLVHQRLCFLEGKKRFCDGREPKGEYRIYVFLQTFNPRYADALTSHNFDYDWGVKEVGDLFRQRVKERSAKLLKALQKDLRHHDGADAEHIQEAISCLKGKCVEREENFGSRLERGKGGSEPDDIAPPRPR